MSSSPSSSGLERKHQTEERDPDLDLDNIQLSDDNLAGTARGLTTKELRAAQEMMRVLHDKGPKTLTETREVLLHAGIHPATSSGDDTILPPLVIDEPNDSAKQGFLEELESDRQQAAETVDIQLDINLDNPKIEDWGLEDPHQLDQDDIENSPALWDDEKSDVLDQPGYDNTTQDEAEPRSQWETVMISHFSTLYSNLKVALDRILIDGQEMKSIMISQQTELKMVRDEQRRLDISIQDLAGKVKNLTDVSTANCKELDSVQQELSICTSGFSKLNSALLQLNTREIPLGKIPLISDYQTSVSHSDPATMAGLKITPIPYTDDHLKELLVKVSIPAIKTDTVISMLNNRTVKAFARLLPTLNPNSTVSDASVQKILQMPSISNKDELAVALAQIKAILLQDTKSEPTIVPGTSALGRPQHSTSTPLDGAPVSMVKKSYNPFSKK